jgi:hypothetical protein
MHEPRSGSFYILWAVTVPRPLPSSLMTLVQRFPTHGFGNYSFIFGIAANMHGDGMGLGHTTRTDYTNYNCQR